MELKLVGGPGFQTFGEGNCVWVVPDWNLVTEKLPSDYHWVIVYEKRNGTGEPSPYSIGRWEIDHWVLLAGEDGASSDLWWDIDAKNITHWISFPKAPQ